MHYDKCPKCAFAPLPADQAFPAGCPRCGLILAKFGAAPPAGSRSATALASARGADTEYGDDSLLQRLLGPFTYVPAQVLRSFWILRIAGLVAMALATLYLLARYDLESGKGGLWLVHAFITPFHEVGHLVFMPFGELMMNLGGTIGQHAVCIGIGALFLYRNRDPFAAALMLWVLGYSLLAMATYMYDAWNPQVTLLTGRTGDTGGHDWIDIFGDLGLLPRAQPIGRAFHKLAYVVQFAAIGWGAWLVARQSGRLSDEATAEEERPED